MEIHAGQPGTSKRLSPVGVFLQYLLHSSQRISLTQATDTTNIRLVFAAVKETILQNALKDSGIL